MASKAYQDQLLVLLMDAEELTKAHKKLRTGKPGRQWGLGSLNRAVVVSAVSAWEAYLEEVVIEVIEAARPSGPGSSWPAWSAWARSEIGRFHNPNPDQIQSLLRDTLGLSHITSHWSWRNCTPPQAEQRLREALKLRHEIAHGVNPIPKVHNTYANRLPGFIRKLAECTDRAIAHHAAIALNVLLPW